ncbi:MAG: response regulator [Desulfovibrio sp.]
MAQTKTPTTILVVENSQLQAKLISERIENSTGFRTLFANTFDEVQEAIDNHKDELFMAVMNLSIKGASNGEAIDYALSKGLACSILTSTFDEEIRNRYLEKQVLGYFDKIKPADMDKLVELISAVIKNKHIKVLAVDDTKTGLLIMGKLLQNLNYQVLTAMDGKEALDVLRDNPDIQMIVTDYNMPRIDGFELTAEVRKTIPREELAIIGVSAQSSGALTARFLNHGANDFLNKPFEVEEFNCRVTKNIKELENIKAIRDAARKDYLVDALNMKYFMIEGEKRIAAKEEMTLMIAHLDGVEDVNGQHGWQVGDKMISHLFHILKRMDPVGRLIARAGTKYFILAPAMQLAQVERELETISNSIINQPIVHNGARLQANVATGWDHVSDSLSRTIISIQRKMSKDSGVSIEL